MTTYGRVCEPCGGTAFEATPHRNVFGLGADLIRCTSCGAKCYDRLVRTQAEINDSPAAHALADRVACMGSMTNTDPAAAVTERAGVALYYAELLRQLRAWCGGTLHALYEVGFNVGDFLLAARDAGVGQLAGCEPNRRGVAIAAERMPTAWLHHAFLAEAPMLRGFDAVAMLDVVEHTDTPRGDLERAAALLRTGGVMLLKTFYDDWHATKPLLDTSSAHGIKHWGDLERGGYFGPAGHLWHFDQDVLRALIDRSGFDVVNWIVDATWGQVTVFARKR